MQCSMHTVHLCSMHRLENRKVTSLSPGQSNLANKREKLQSASPKIEPEIITDYFEKF